MVITHFRQVFTLINWPQIGYLVQTHNSYVAGGDHQEEEEYSDRIARRGFIGSRDIKSSAHKGSTPIVLLFAALEGKERIDPLLSNNYLRVIVGYQSSLEESHVSQSVWVIQLVSIDRNEIPLRLLFPVPLSLCALDAKFRP